MKLRYVRQKAMRYRLTKPHEYSMKTKQIQTLRHPVQIYNLHVKNCEIFRAVNVSDVKQNRITYS